MKKIKLTQNKFALVDDEDFEYLNQWKWHLSDGGYARRTQHIHLGVRKYSSERIFMHRVINKTPNGSLTDHINRDKLDNRRANLRTGNKSLNSINRDKQSNNKSGHKGVHWDAWSGKWRAELKINYKKVSLGRYLNKEDAIMARKEGEEKYHAI